MLKMNSNQVRDTFFRYFESKQHKILPSAPLVVKDDPTLMFTNAGMNQFKDIFLGNSPVVYPRIANTQKCLRVSGKHNDLEEVGHDTYHHTMFEMLGNWSFGDYFKQEAISWAWELLTEVYQINKDDLYVTFFGGDKEDNLPRDDEALQCWKKIVPGERILEGGKKDNFWEMGETGPCGPCSEIHIDLRSREEKKKVKGNTLVNKGNPLMIEIWNLVFIEFSRKADGSLAKLPSKHVDTGMGFERLNMVMQGKTSNYDTDIFQPIIRQIEVISGRKYGDQPAADTAMRVISDHLRALAFGIADGQLPSNIKAGYVLRRILRRAVRYGYTFLGLKEPFLASLVPVLTLSMGDVFPEIREQKELIIKVMAEEEESFLRTLSQGIRKFELYVNHHPDSTVMDGDFAFELFDTYGFPVDLTQVMAAEQGRTVDLQQFNTRLGEQKERSRQAASKDAGDWVVLREDAGKSEFVGYDTLECSAVITRYRKIKTHKEEYFQIILDRTPFYAESGGQVGDRGYLYNEKEKIAVENTAKEHDLAVHVTRKLPSDPLAGFTASVDRGKRTLTANNHSATHLMHRALKMVLGDHVQQKGSLVDENHLRFDFSHFARITSEELRNVETIVNGKIRENLGMSENRNIPLKSAMEMGATALFGEKYGETVRMITFGHDFSRELCGGTHVPATGQIGLFKIVSESSIAAGIRRIEAVTGPAAEQYINERLDVLDALKELFKSPGDLVGEVRKLIEQHAALRKQVEEAEREKLSRVRDDLAGRIEYINGIAFLASRVPFDATTCKDLAFQLKSSTENLFLVLGCEVNGKAFLTVMISENLVKEKDLNASGLVRELAREIGGSGGGQPFFATAGGKNPGGLDKAFQKARNLVAGIS
jgi:alanyl-tRNA synthetase